MNTAEPHNALPPPSSRVLRELMGDAEIHAGASEVVKRAFRRLREVLAHADRATADRDDIERSLIAQMGYPGAALPAAVLKRETRALDMLGRATARFFASDIRTPREAALFIAVVIACGEPGPPDASSFPWAQLRKAFAALQEI